MSRTILIAMVAALLALAMVSASTAATYKSIDNKVVITAPVIEFTSSGVVAKGGAHIQYADPKTQSQIVADAKEVSLTLLQKAGANQADSVPIKQADMKGNVHLVSNGVDENGVKWTADAKCDKAVYTGADQLAKLTGNVQINYTNPALFDGPCVVSGDKATVNTKKALAEDEFRFRIESAPGVSKVEVTPTPKKAETTPKTEPENAK